MKLFAAWIIVLLQAVTASPPLLQQMRGSIEGVVARIGTEEPILGAQLTLSRVSGAGPQLSIPPMATDSAGKFSFKDLEAGTYKLTVVSNGYARQDYGQRGPGMPSAPIVLAAGENVRGISVHLTPAGGLSGHLRNSSGQPVVGVPVELARRSYGSGGNVSFQSAGVARTDDHGEYRFYWITPGRYFVVAGQGVSIDRRGFGNDSGNENEVVDQYPYTFFPGSIQFEKAVPIDLQAGSELHDVDFALAQTGKYRIRMHVVEPVTGVPPRQASVTISYWNPHGVLNVSSTGFYEAKSGVVEFKDLDPGVFNITVAAYDSPGVTGAISKRNGAGPSVAANVLISNADVDLGDVMVVAPQTINGRISVEGASLDAPSLKSMQIRLVAPSVPGQSSLDASLQNIRTSMNGDGTFTGNFPFTSLRVSELGIPPGYFIREAKLDGKEALTNSAPVSGAGELVVVLSSRSGELAGVVRDDHQQPVIGVQAVLVPDGTRNYPDLFMDAVSDQNGRILISSIPPGDYKLFAWDGLEPYTYFDPEVLQKYEPKGQPVHIVESSHETLDVKMISVQGE